MPKASIDSIALAIATMFHVTTEKLMRSKARGGRRETGDAVTARIAFVSALKDEGYTASEIADHTGLHINSVHAILRRAGIVTIAEPIRESN